MATYTKNYRLTKPDETDPVDINVLNGNMDEIDARLHEKADQTTVDQRDADTLAAAKAYVDEETAGLQAAEFPVKVTKSGDAYSADKTYREVQAAFAQKRDVYMIYDGARYDPSSKSDGPYPYFRFSYVTVGSNVVTERKFVYRMGGLNPVLEYEEHTSSSKKQVFTAVITSEVGRLVCDMTAREIIDASRNGVVRAEYTDDASGETRVYQFAKQTADGKAVFSKDGYIEGGKPKQALITIDYAGNVKVETLEAGTDANLKEAGVPADAKKTGDLIAALTARIEALEGAK